MTEALEAILDAVAGALVAPRKIAFLFLFITVGVFSRKRKLPSKEAHSKFNHGAHSKFKMVAVLYLNLPLNVLMLHWPKIRLSPANQ